jgi:hypothetical protein
MNKLTHPTKEQVRDWMEHRQAGHRPLPDIKQIRRELGWGMNKSGPNRH